MKRPAFTYNIRLRIALWALNRLCAASHHQFQKGAVRCPCGWMRWSNGRKVTFDEYERNRRNGP